MSFYVHSGSWFLTLLTHWFCSLSLLFFPQSQPSERELESGLICVSTKELLSSHCRALLQVMMWVKGKKPSMTLRAQGAYAIRKDLSTWKLSPFELAWETINMEPNKVILTESFFRVELLSNHLWCSSLDVPGLYWYHPGAEVHWTVYSIIVFPVLC